MLLIKKAVKPEIKMKWISIEGQVPNTCDNDKICNIINTYNQ